ncbi:MAG TPA: M42 family peptidase [Oscillospiraceae bacterium]|nr:M42 family peptidase [Oscillospiraceae bacterium]
MLEKLCQLNGTSGNENAVRDFIIEQIKDNCTYTVDNLSNLIAEKKGLKTPLKKIMVAAHMDEVALIVNYIREDGSLSISPVGGIDPLSVMGRKVSINGISGVIGSKAVHHLSDDEKKTPPKFKDLFIDIGSDSKKRSEKYIKLGDIAYFDSDFVRFGDDYIKGKAIDDRFGCKIMIDLINGEISYDTTFVFTAQEEIGTRGSKAAAFSVAPDFAIVLETTTAADIPVASGEKRVCALKKGAVVSYMDRGTIYDKELYNLAFKTAEENNIPIQTKTMVAGGNDSGAIHVSGKGVRTLAISAPCRYLHSPSCVVNSADLDACARLAKAIIEKIGEL